MKESLLQTLKKSNVLLIHTKNKKKLSKQYADNYRPLSLLCIMGKIFEYTIQYVYYHFCHDKLINPWQSVVNGHTVVGSI